MLTDLTGYFLYFKTKFLRKQRKVDDFLDVRASLRWLTVLVADAGLYLAGEDGRETQLGPLQALQVNTTGVAPACLVCCNLTSNNLTTHSPIIDPS